MDIPEKFDTLAKRVAYARSLIGVNQSQLAALIGKKAQTIQSIEIGRSKKSHFALDIAGVCQVDPIWLATGEGEPRPIEQPPHKATQTQPPYEIPSREAHEIAMIWSALPDYRRQCIRDLLFIEAVVAKRLPRLQLGRPIKESYNQFEKRVNREIQQLTKRGK